MPANTATSDSLGLPSLSVPVLSSTTSLTRARRCSASARTGNTPSFASAPFAAASAAGTAKDKAQGQLMTTNASMTSNAREGSWARQAK